MAFTRIRTRNGVDYMYEEHRWREGKKVRSKSIYLGRVGGSAPPVNMRRARPQKPSFALFGIDWTATLQNEPGARAMEKWEEEANEASKQELAKMQAFKDKEARHSQEQKAITLAPPDTPAVEQSPAVSEAPAADATPGEVGAS